VGSAIQMFTFAGLPRGLPAGYGAAPIAENERGAVRLCAVVRTTAKGETPLVVLREMLDAKVLLGCLADAGGRVQQWVEIWVQDTGGLGEALPGYRAALNNTMLDRRWAARCESFDAMEGGGGSLVRTGWEKSNPPPLFVDIKKLEPVAAKDKKTGATWALCRDEELLARKGVPAFATTVNRHLFQPEMGEETMLLPLEVVGGDPSAMGIGSASEVAPVNGGGGLMMVRPFAPLSYEQYVDAISGVDGDAGASEAVLKTISANTTAGANAGPGKTGGWLGLGGVGMAGRMVEALHLKLMLLAGAASAVRATASAAQTPMLNVTANSFRVSLGSGTGVLPLWWTARAQLAEPGEGVELPIEGTSAKYYLTSRGGGMSIYAPAAMSRSASGKGWLRLRNVVGESGGVILEGTLSTQERISPGTNDLLWLRFGVGQTRVDLYSMVDAQGAMAAGEIRIRTIAHKLPDDVVARLKSALGVPIPEVSFEMVPLISTPCDLYALGVLGVRTLLVGPKRPLPVALDEILSLAAQAGKDAESGESLPTRLERVFTTDKRWNASLGPQWLLAGGGSAEDALVAIPPRLWFGTLAMMIRMFTGQGPDSCCRDLGDAPAGGIHNVFDGVLEDLYALLTACRSLIVSDYALNTDVRSVVNECMAAAKR
jgi:hypothetical protein